MRASTRYICALPLQVDINADDRLPVERYLDLLADAKVKGYLFPMKYYVPGDKK